MTRPFRIAIAVTAAVALSVAIAVPAIAAATGPKGTLTSTEYSQLTTEQVEFKKLEKKKNLTLAELYKACRVVGQSTVLLKSIRSNCEAGLGFDQTLIGFYSDVARCGALSTGTTTTTTTTPTSTGTTTTGTTTTTTGTGTTTTGTGTTTTSTGALTPTELKLYACLQPEFVVISRAVGSVYHSQTKLRAKVLARDFTGRCELTLAPTVAQLKALKHFLATSAQLSKDVSLITKVANGKAPASSIDETQIEKDGASFDSAAKAFSALHRPQKLSVCPHQ